MCTFFNKMFRVVTIVLVFVAVCVARELSDEELHRLPKLFHLDDYDRCLSQRDGVYCVGTFELVPRIKPNPYFDIITEQLKQHFSFDRRLLHRGYCLSKRCQSDEKNSTLRFEQCAERYVRKHALTARLKKLSYCMTHAQRKAKLAQAPDLPQRIFLYVVYFILFANVVGTVYDVFSDAKKNKHLVAWSMRENWRALTTVEDGDSPFAPIQSSKIILHFLIIYTHAFLLHFMGYMNNPEVVEKSRDRFMNVLIRNGTSLVQVFILISSFFTGCNVLETARRSSVSARRAGTWILKRLFRLAPVYLLLTAYSATWWVRAGDGPLWAHIVEPESQICRRKFWTHVLFLNNFIEPWDLCMVQSWAIAAEVQLFLVSLLLTILLIKLKVRAVPVLAALFAASCLFNVTLAYVAGLVPMVKIIVPENLRTKFRGSRSFFHLHTSPWSNLPACFFGLLIAHIYFEQKNKARTKAEDRNKSNGSIQNRLVKENGVHDQQNGACVKENGNCMKENDTCVTENVGQVKENGAHVKENGEHLNGMSVHDGNSLRNRKHNTDNIENDGVVCEKSFKGENGAIKQNNVVHENQNGSMENKHTKDNKKVPFLLRYAHCFTFPTLIVWVVLGSRVTAVDSALAIALYVGLERLMFSLTFACQILQIITVKGPWARLMSWRGWTVPARLVLSVAMVHWCVNATMLASRAQPVASSLTYVNIDWLATLVYSYLVALPLSVLVELPMKRAIDALVS